MSPLTMVYLNILNDIKQVIELTYASKCIWNVYPGDSSTIYLWFNIDDDPGRKVSERAPRISWNSGPMSSLDTSVQFRVLIGFLKSEFDFVQQIIDDYPKELFI